MGLRDSMKIKMILSFGEFVQDMTKVLLL